MTISVEKDLKNEFFVFSKELWSNPTNLMNMFMKDSIRKRKIEFSTASDFDMEIEAFSKEEMQSFWKEFLQKTLTNTQKLEELLTN